MQRRVSASAGERLTIVVDRNGREVTVEATPDLKEQTTPFGKQRIGLLGLRPPESGGREAGVLRPRPGPLRPA